MKHISIKFKLLFFLLAVTTMSCFSGNVRLSVDAPRGKRSIEVGDVFYVTIEVSDIDGAPERPSEMPGAQVLYFDRTGQSSRFTSVNGKTTQSYSYTWTMTLRARKEGSFSYGPITVGGTKSNKLSYSIGKAQPAYSTSQGNNRQPSQNQAIDHDDPTKPKFIGKGDGNLFLRANVSKTSVYEQEAIVYTVKLFTTYDAIKFIGATAAPKFDGFVVEESKAISNSLSYETYQGKTYATAIIARYIIFPQMTGQLKVSGNTYTVSVDQREYYHDPFWGSLSYSTPLQLNVTPNDLTINVNPLPSPKPSDFSGGVGSFNISSQLKSTSFKTNEAASIVYTVTGVGNLKYIQLPDLSVIYPQEIEIYTPKTDVKTNVGASEVSGSVTFDYSFVPLEEGQFRIPEIKLVYFNPATGKYETSVSKSYDIIVGRGKGSASSETRLSKKFDSALIPVNISQLKKRHTNMVDSFAYWLWYIVPLILLIGSYGYYRYYLSSHADMAALNSRRANKLANRRLKKAYANMQRKNTDGFYTELLVALWGYLGDKLKMPTSELMRDNIRSVLEQKHIPEQTIELLLAELDRCEYAKYSPDRGQGDMEAIYDSAIEVINSLEKSFKKTVNNEK